MGGRGRRWPGFAPVVVVVVGIVGQDAGQSWSQVRAAQEERPGDARWQFGEGVQCEERVLTVPPRSPCKCSAGKRASKAGPCGCLIWGLLRGGEVTTFLTGILARGRAAEEFCPRPGKSLYKTKGWALTQHALSGALLCGCLLDTGSLVGGKPARYFFKT